MVQVVENWSDVEGAVTRVSSSTRGANFRDVEVQASVVADVPGFRNLLKTRPQPLVVTCSTASVAGGVRPGAVVRGRLRLAGPAVVMPDGAGLRPV